METPDTPAPPPHVLGNDHPWLRSVRNAAEAVLDLIYPPRCLLCGKFGPKYLCDDCGAQLFTPLPEPICKRCGHPIVEIRCRHCAERPPAFVRSRSASLYASDLRLSIHLLKYRDKPMLAEPLGQLLAGFAENQKKSLNGLSFDAVVPVPMHPTRRRLRGYNHAERLACAFAGELGLPLNGRILQRERNTKPQVGFARDKRLSNLAGAFAADPGSCTGKTILVIDDVSTTGSTLHECAVALRSAGAKAVYCLTLAVG